MREELVILEGQVDVLQKALVASARQKDDVLALNANQVSALEEAEARLEAMKELLAETRTQIKNLTRDRDELQADLRRTHEMTHAHNRALQAALEKSEATNAELRSFMGHVGDKDIASLHAAFTKERAEASRLDNENIELAVLVDFLQQRLTALESDQQKNQESQHFTSVGCTKLDALEGQLQDSATRCHGLQRQIVDTEMTTQRDKNTVASITGKSEIGMPDLMYRTKELAAALRKRENELDRTREQLQARYLVTVT